jgi:general secretion pathway protein J
MKRASHLFRGFTLIEIVMALSASALILAAIYSVFSKAIHLRDNATARTRDGRVRARAAAVMRNDLRNALVSGGKLAAVLQGSHESQSSSLPGYLKFTTTTGQDTDVYDDPSPDVQQVEYFLVEDTAASAQRAGLLVRAVDRNLLAQIRETPPEETLLTGVGSLDVSFFDGKTWKDSWAFSADDQTLPEAVRVIVREPSLSSKDRAAVLIDVLVPWTNQPAIQKKQ